MGDVESILVLSCEYQEIRKKDRIEKKSGAAKTFNVLGLKHLHGDHGLGVVFHALNPVFVLGAVIGL